MKTAKDFKRQAERKGITEWKIHDCLMCGYPCGYIIYDGRVFYDGGCYCVKVKYRGLQSRTFEDIAKHYNMQENPEYIKTMNKFWGFNNVQNAQASVATEAK